MLLFALLGAAQSAVRVAATAVAPLLALAENRLVKNGLKIAGALLAVMAVIDGDPTLLFARFFTAALGAALVTICAIPNAWGSPIAGAIAFAFRDDFRAWLETFLP